MTYSEKPQAGSNPGPDVGAVRGIARNASERLSRLPRPPRTGRGARETFRRRPTDAQKDARESVLAQERLAEWARLHHLLHQVLATAAPFEAGLATLPAHGQLGPDDQRELLLSWRLCQQKINALVDFAEGIEHVGKRFERRAHELQGARWAVAIVAVQLVIEDTLKDQRPLAEALVELADDLRSVCYRHLAEADGEMMKLIDLLQRPLAAQVGGSA